MSGPERCVNPNCTQYGHIQEGACTLRPLVASGGWPYPDWHSGIADKTAKEMAGLDIPAPAVQGKERVVTEAIDRRYQELESYYFGNQLGQVMNGVMVMLCTSCGALCGNTRRHALWHEGMRGRK